MREEEIIKKLDDIWNNCEEIDNHNLETERTGYKMYDDYIFVRDGIERLNSIIKEVREYIKDYELYYDEELGLVEMMGAGSTRTPVIESTPLLEILDKVEEK